MEDHRQNSDFEQFFYRTDWIGFFDFFNRYPACKMKAGLRMTVVPIEKKDFDYVVSNLERFWAERAEHGFGG